jgi:D-beta-D-heptose 7-phosphate kinase/D-beta-D-heptose 1-phosphate adenosyltransferase
MQNKLKELDELKETLERLRNEGQRIVFTNGCFDILHAGHVRYLNAARQQGDLLVVGLNSDASVQRIKGPRRPLVSQQQRAEVLAGLWCVEFIVIFDQPDPLAVIQTLRPNVLVKGEDWPDDQIVGSDVVKADGGRVVRIPVVPDISTSRIIERIVDRFSRQEK